MKRLTFGALTAILFLLPPCAGAQNAQSDQNAQSTQNARYALTTPRAEANHSVVIDLSGLRYGYELPLGPMGTIIGRVGVDMGGDDYFVATPSIELEPRLYYGLERRAAMGRSTAKNAGSFMSLNVKNYFPWGYVSDRELKFVGATTFSPTWGFRRVWGEGWMFEFRTGLVWVYLHRGVDTLGFSLPGGDYHIDYHRRLFWLPQLNIRFGYAF